MLSSADEPFPDMNLPTYPEPPSYSSHPSRGEERLLINARTTVPSGTFIKESATFTLVLHGQDDNTAHPCYGRSDSIVGILNVKQTENISLVTLKWSKSKSDGALGPRANHFPFSFALPADYISGTSKRFQLPPSLNFHDTNLTACVHYSVKATVIRTRRLHSTKVESSDENLLVEIEYRPRSRPVKPLTIQTYVSSIKDAPEAWHQANGKLTYVDGLHPQINCDFFFPSSQVFGLDDVIPFHIQLRSSGQGLADFLPPSYHTLVRPSHHGSPPLLKVELIRQILVTGSEGHKFWTNGTLGEGNVSQLLRSQTEELGLPVHQDELRLHWQGTVKCCSAERVPSFHMQSLVLKASFIHYSHSNRVINDGF
ncbi:hypothetical protein DL96DRAFT_1818184 [Flagelloscypha sp. PMI_526]|nr:hypothetical protein DL96DRAFT_1818184 [Flagelloscypha sp. PMI_526]